VLGAAARYAAHVDFLLVYITEAHASDGWAMPEENENKGVSHRQPVTLAQRAAIAAELVRGSQGGVPAHRVLVDGMDNAAELAYEARPERLYVVSGGGGGGGGGGDGGGGGGGGGDEMSDARRILFRTGIGPYQYSPAQLVAFLEARFPGVGGGVTAAAAAAAAEGGRGGAGEAAAAQAPAAKRARLGPASGMAVHGMAVAHFSGDEWFREQARRRELARTGRL
jgi:hypothetical protein